MKCSGLTNSNCNVNRIVIVIGCDVNTGEHPAAIHGDNGCSLLPQPGVLLVLITSLLLLLSRHWWCFHILNRPTTLQ